jgi:hypothetical protein
MIAPLLVALAACDQRANLALRPDALIEPLADRGAGDQRSLPRGWALALGSVGNAMATGVVALPDGTIAIAGQFSGDPDRILGTSVTAETPWGIFVSRIDSDGKALWTTALPGPGTFSLWPTIGGLAADPAGNLYVGDAFSGRARFGAAEHTARGETDLYVAKLDPQGQLLWATVAGGDETDRVHRIAVDAEGQVTVTGTFAGTVSFGDTTLVARGLNDVLVARLSPRGEFLWATRAGGEHDGGATDEFGNGLALDPRGSTYVAARFKSATAFEGPLCNEVKKGGPLVNDTFVAKLDDRGKCLWATAAPYTRIEIPTGLAFDTAGDLYVSGSATLQGILCRVSTDGAFASCPLLSQCGAECFVASVILSTSGRATVAGQLASPCSLGQSTGKGPVDAFVARLDSLGNVEQVERAGGPGATCRALGLARAASGDLYAVGSFTGAPALGEATIATRRQRDGFVWKIPRPEP